MDPTTKISELLQEFNLRPNIKLEQHFMRDETILQQVINAADLKKEDVVLEIGPGFGILTEELAPKVKKVIAIEIDTHLKPVLKKLPENVEVIFDNALTVLPTRKDFNKIVANIPYQICEPLLNYLCAAKNVELSVLTVPKNFATKASEHPIFSAFFEFELIAEVPKDAFFPAPKVISAIVKITPTTKEDDNLFVRRKLYLQRDKKLKNSLRDTLIDLYKKRKKELTKKQADKLVESLKLTEELLEKTSARISLIKYISICNSLEMLVET